MRRIEPAGWVIREAGWTLLSKQMLELELEWMWVVWLMGRCLERWSGDIWRFRLGGEIMGIDSGVASMVFLGGFVICWTILLESNRKICVFLCPPSVVAASQVHSYAIIQYY
ncbi:hypothetical protein GYMLUDRAFT_342975 [Collybiopsis luxurians FD-317 M1]|nr:hypothetical protein GYMLUDRAFT_342975 [Collybiopsis luxurians FD-317 M1]